MKILIVMAIMVVQIGILVGCNTNKVGELEVFIRNTNNEPLAGAKVISNTQPDGQLKVTGLTNSEGRVFFTGIKTGNYEFYVSRFDYVQKEFDITVKAGRITSITIVLSPS